MVLKSFVILPCISSSSLRVKRKSGSVVHTGVTMTLSLAIIQALTVASATTIVATFLRDAACENNLPDDCEFRPFRRISSTCCRAFSVIAGDVSDALAWGRSVGDGFVVAGRSARATSTVAPLSGEVTPVGAFSCIIFDFRIVNATLSPVNRAVVRNSTQELYTGSTAAEWFLLRSYISPHQTHIQSFKSSETTSFVTLQILPVSSLRSW